VEGVRWGADSRTIAFLGRRKGQERHLFTVNVNNGVLQQLSPAGQDVTAFDWTRKNFVFTSAIPVSDSELYQSAGPSLPGIQIGTGQSLFTLVYPKWEEVTFGVSSQQLWQVRNGAASRLIDADTSSPISLIRGLPLTSLAASPSGRYVVAVNNVGHVPQAWRLYEPAFPFAQFVPTEPDSAPVMSNLSPAQFVLVDLKLRKALPLIDAPIGWSAGYFWNAVQAKWSNNEQEVALSNVFIPFTDQDLQPLQHKTLRPCVAVVNIASHKAECVLENPGSDHRDFAISNLDWASSGNELVVRHIRQQNGDGAQELFSRQGGNWTKLNHVPLGDADPSDNRLSVEVQQAINDPPVLVANEPQIGRQRVLFDPNPRLAAVELGDAAPYHWRDKAGHAWTGGLVMPPDHGKRRYPLVLQTHGFDPDEFLSDGIYSTANAARALAARGIVVLQVAENTTVPLFSPQEAEVDGRAGYESGIDQLAKDGTIDSKNVGIIGFSHTGWLVLDTLIHSPQYFRAATLAESTYDSFGEYLINADYRGSEPAKVIAESIGSTPFGEGIQNWLTRSPGFNTDKIYVPVLFEENSPAGLIYSWDLYAALRLQSKPVEMLYMRNGAHVLTKPLELLASQEMTVDWYDFWLNRHEDPNPAKAAQYTRWRELRRIQERNITSAH
jgi:hypothetical protein